MAHPREIVRRIEIIVIKVGKDLDSLHRLGHLRPWCGAHSTPGMLLLVLFPTQRVRACKQACEQRQKSITKTHTNLHFQACILCWHGRFATRFARIDSRESFAIEPPIFTARQAIRTNQSNFRFGWFARIVRIDSRESRCCVVLALLQPPKPWRIKCSKSRGSGPTQKVGVKVGAKVGVTVGK